jgi:hypothetical protein
MDKALLVAAELATGGALLQAFDHAKLDVRVALWAFMPDFYSDWRFVLASPHFDAVGIIEANGMIWDALHETGFPFAQKPSFLILSMHDPFTRTLRRIFGKTKNVDGMRLGGQVIGDRFIEDAYVYRIR